MGLPAGRGSGRLSRIGKQSETMPRVSRRSFLAASAAFAARPAFSAAQPQSGDTDVVIVGAGAAGIAAARRLAAAGRRFVVIEAAGHIGGRCITDNGTFGLPFDRGAHWIYWPRTNPLTRTRLPRGIEIYPAPRSQTVRIGLRNARERELEDFFAAEIRASRAIAQAARKADMPCARALPDDLGDWQRTVEFVLGPYAFGKDLRQLSAVDFARAADRNAAAFCRQGFGAVLAALGSRIEVRLSTPATAIEIDRGVTVETPNGRITASAAIVTASTNVISSGRIQFTPSLPGRLADAFARLSLGSYDHIALMLSGNPLGLDSDDLVFEKATDSHTAAILGNVSGTSLCLVEVAGSFGRALSAQGEAAMVDFAGEWLGRLYGADAVRAIRQASATRWNADPWTLGAASAATPGGAGARAILSRPLLNAVWFAGEAVHETHWGTVSGAWESGEHAADAVLRRLGGEPESPSEPKIERPVHRPEHRRRRRRGADHQHY
jgi:monoamine oxidase